MRGAIHGVVWVSVFAFLATWGTERMKYEARKRTLVVLFDGTGEDRLYTHRPPTNIGRFAAQVRKVRNPANVIMYHRGVATSEEHGLPFSKIPGLIAGRGLPQVVQEMYLTIVDNYKAGDSIYIIGYSRGAAAAQELAFMLDNLGIPRSSSYAREAAKKVFKKIAQQRKGKVKLIEDHMPKPLDADHIPVKIRFLGLFDCVVATGSLLHLGRLPNSVEAAYHAVGIDERRRHFTVTLLGDRALEVWFAGCHSNVGGGNGCALSDITLRWMLQMARRHGLDAAPFEVNMENAELEVEQAWNNWLVRAVGEMRPRAMPEGSIVHHSVRQMIQNTTYRPRNLPKSIRVLSPTKRGWGKASKQNWYTPCNVSDAPGRRWRLDCGQEALLQMSDPHVGNVQVLPGTTTSLGKKAHAVAKATGDMLPEPSNDKQGGAKWGIRPRWRGWGGRGLNATEEGLGDGLGEGEEGGREEDATEGRKGEPRAARKQKDDRDNAELTPEVGGSQLGGIKRGVLPRWRGWRGTPDVTKAAAEDDQAEVREGDAEEGSNKGTPRSQEGEDKGEHEGTQGTDRRPTATSTPTPSQLEG